MFPTLFISHGAPNIILGDSKTVKNMKKFSKSLKKPKYIIIFSAHYVTEGLKIIDYDKPELLYDFYGFEKELYDYKYEIKSDKTISHEIINHLNAQGLDISIDKGKNTYDHGVWTTLSMMYKKLDIPVIQISIPYTYSEKELIELGEKLQVFKNEALIITSGGITHNLSDMSMSTEVKEYAKKFNDIIIDIIKKGDKDELLDIVKERIFYQNHPTREHFLPIYIAFGNAIDKKGESFNSEMVYSNISMECFIFDKE